MSNSRVWRIGVSPRLSQASVGAGLAAFAVTPAKPYDAALSAGEQTRQILKRLDERLLRLGTDKRGILFVTIIVRDIATLSEVNAMWDSWVDPASPPSRASFEAPLADPAMKVEFVVQAVVEDDADLPDGPRGEII